MQISYAAQTDLGMQRTNNEDNYFLLDEQHLYTVADGMGGHASGEVASLLAVQALANYFARSSGAGKDEWPFELAPNLDRDEKRLATGIKLANQEVHRAAQQGGRYRGMGTTIVALLLGQAAGYLAHVGDSRGYRIRNNEIQLLTEDHSLVNEFIKLHRLRPEDAQNFTHKNVIVRALGLDHSVDVDIQRLEPQPGETYLLCSDGLTDLLDDQGILAQVMSANGDLQQGCANLVNAANQSGGIDNITVALISFSD